MVVSLARPSPKTSHARISSRFLNQKELDPDFVDFNSVNRRYHYPVRTYVPFCGAFLQLDPLWFSELVARYTMTSTPTRLVDPMGLQEKKEPPGYIGKDDCAKKMKERKEGREKLVGEERRKDPGTCAQCDNCQLLTILIELPHSCQKGIGARIGHTGLAVGDQYYDFGPSEPVTKEKRQVAGTQYWDDPKKHEKKEDPSDVRLKDVLAKIPTLAATPAVKSDVFKIEICVTKDMAALVEYYWKQLYKDIKEGKAQYSPGGLQCTSAVMRSLGDWDSGGCDTNLFMNKIIGARHSCCSNKGELVKVELLQAETDPHA